MRSKEVVNAKDCKVLGYVGDVDFDVCSGKIVSLIVPEPFKMCKCFCTQKEYIIPYKCIVNMGPDVILVDIKCESSIEKN